MIEKLKEILREKKINLIIFGETHGFLDDDKIQKGIIKYFKPTIFLYEMLEETKLLTTDKQKEFLKESNEKDFSVISTFGELKKTINLATKYNLPIVGNDIKNMCRENKDFLKKTELSEEEIKKEEEILFKREKMQCDTILSYLKNNKRVLVTTGAFHLRPNSPLINLKEDYLYVYPSYEGEQLFEPPKDFDITKAVFEVKEITSHV
jgi:hypothetical protein